MDARFNREDLIHRITKIADCAGRIEVTCADAVELTAWLEADDVKGRAMRARRLRNLLDTLPVPPDGLSFLGGGESAICFDEVRRCLYVVRPSWTLRRRCVETHPSEWPRDAARVSSRVSVAAASAV